MASTSPQDGRPSDPSPDLEPEQEISFVRVITIRPRDPRAPRFRDVLPRLAGPLKRLTAAALGGGFLVFIYCLLNPAERYFKPFPPWSPETSVLFPAFLFGGLCVWLFLQKKRGA